LIFARLTAALASLTAALALAGEAPRSVDSVVLEIPDATGPSGPSCREALQLPPPEQTTPPEPTPTDEAVTPEPVPDLSRFPSADPATLSLQRLEGPPEVLARIAEVVRRGEGGGRVRLSFWGASHTGADLWTGRIRRRLQDLWGDLGHGFVMPAALYRGYRANDVNLCRTRGWRSDWIGRRRGRDDGLLGFSGASVSSADPEDFGWIQTTETNPHGRRVDRFEVFALAHPAGGTLRIDVDGATSRALSTTAPERGLLRASVRVPDGPHRMTLTPTGDGEVRLLGVSAERSGPGALVDAIGIRGRRATDWLDWDEGLLEAGMTSLSPDLVVLAYGTNEAAATKYTMDEYREDLAAVLARLRRVVPESVPCVLVGPSDRAKKVRGDWTVWPRTAEVAAVQRELAPTAGCAFWDWQQATGGPGSMVAWRFREPPLASPDGIHHTRDGYELMGDRFVDALFALLEQPPLE
jgi:lysophospholipase L1-like esterase